MILRSAIRNLVLLGASWLLILVSVSEARAQSTPQPTWNKNQTFQCGSSPATIPSNYETYPNCTATLCPGTPVHIVYGISDPNANANPVTVTIAMPPTGFNVLNVRAVEFGGGTLSTQPTKAISQSYVIGPLLTYHVIIVIDGYFTQASSFSFTFKASRSGVPDEVTNLNMSSTCQNPPINLSITKTASPTSAALGSTVTYTLTVKNTSTPQTDHSTDLYLGGLLTVIDTLSVNGNGLPLNVTLSGFNCSTSTGGAAHMDCPTTSIPISLPANYSGNSSPLTFQYPSSGTDSDGYLPAQQSFSITFNAVAQTTATCTQGPTNKIINTASIKYSTTTATISDSNSSDDSSATTVSITGGPTNSCPPPSPTPAIPVTKTGPTTGTWGTPLTYQIEVTNTTNTTLTGVVVNDLLAGILGAPLFTATLVGNVTCTPNTCANVTLGTNLLTVGSNWASLFSATLPALSPSPSPGSKETVTFQVQYDAPCGDGATGGSIRNYAYLSGPVTGTSLVDTAMPALSPCPLQVIKTQTSGPTSFSQYPQTLGYHVQFKNNSSTQAITVGTVLDTIAEDSPNYGDVPIDYNFTCTSSGVSPNPAANGSATNKLVKYNASVGSGLQLLNFSGTTGATFQPGGHIDCDLNVTLKQPSITDSLCQGAGSPHVTNRAFMNLLPGIYTTPAQSSWYADVITPLPYCVSIRVGKTAPATVSPGGAVTFTLTVKNDGKDPVSSVVLHDLVPAAFSNVTWTCAPTTGCTAGGGNGPLVSVNLSPNLAPGATVTILVNATAPAQIGAAAICNDTNATFEPFPAQTYFEGEAEGVTVESSALTKAEACIQVVSNEGTPTPTPTASPVDTGSPTPTPTPTPAATPGCAQVTGDARCLPNGGYSYTFTIKNNSGKPMSQILLTPAQGSTFTLSPQLTNLPTPLQSGQSATVTTTIGTTNPEDKVCFFVSLMADKAPCCIVQVCPTLPKCGGVSPTPTVTSSLPPTLRKQPSVVRPPPPSRRGRRR